jgi:hypothetical protein
MSEGTVAGIEPRTEYIICGESENWREWRVSGTLDISACGRDSRRSAIYKHLTLRRSSSVHGPEADSRTNSNHGSLICACYGEMFSKGDVLEVSRPEEE